jgi:hypothetical protein
MKYLDFLRILTPVRSLGESWKYAEPLVPQSSIRTFWGYFINELVMYEIISRDGELYEGGQS